MLGMQASPNAPHVRLGSPLVQARERLRNNPLTFQWLWGARQRPAVGHRLPRAGDHLVVEGFPRSANSFAREAFIAAQPGPATVVSHFHSSAMFALAERHAIPSMLLLREPVSACAALMVYQETLQAAAALIRYIAFHQPLLVRRRKLTLVTFEEATTRFDAAIARLNRQFGVAYTMFDHSDDNVRDVLDAVVRKRDEKYRKLGRPNAAGRFHLPGPDARKEAAKEAAYAALRADGLFELRTRATVVYERVKEIYAT